MNLKLMTEETLQKIDNFFKEKSQKDTYVVYALIVVVIFALAYPFYDISISEFETTKKKVQELTTKIESDKIYLKVNTEAKVAMLTQEIKGLETELTSQKEKNSYIKKKIEAISELIYDERAWGEYLNSISLNAKKHNIKIVNFVNSYAKNDESAFGHVLDINLEVKGAFLDTIKFMNSLEQSELVVDMHDFSIEAKDTLDTNLDISVWGITY